MTLSLLTLFKKIIFVYAENHPKQKNVKTDFRAGEYIFQQALKG